MGKVTDLRVFKMVAKLSTEWSNNYFTSVGFDEFLMCEMGITYSGYNQVDFEYQIADEQKFAWYLLSHE